MPAPAYPTVERRGRSLPQAHRAPGPRAGAMVDAESDFTAFFSTELPRVVRTVALIVGDRGQAEDIAQDAFVQLLEHWAKVSRYEQPDAWVRRVAIRMATRTARRERLRQVLEQAFRRVDEAPAVPERDGDVLDAVRRLPLRQRTAVVLFYFEDRSVDEVADLLGCAPPTARVHLHQARRRLATLLGEETPDVP